MTQTEMGILSQDNIFSIGDSESKTLLNQSGQTVLNKIQESNLESPSPTLKRQQQESE